MEISYVIVQAGGKGARLGHLTANKPKALAPVENLPILFHLFRLYPNKRYIIIADYKKEVLREYLAAFAPVTYQVVDADGQGTCAGVGRALALLPPGQPFMLIWSDLILPANFALPDRPGRYIGVSQGFPCRWSYQDGKLAEEPSERQGVAGLFIFESKDALADVPASGELVRWLSGKDMSLTELGLAGAREYGLLAEYEALGADRCRPFNKITVDGAMVIKEGIDERGRELARLERQWYEYAGPRVPGDIPQLYGWSPLRMERIKGQAIYEYTDFTARERLAVLRQLIEALRRLHSLGRVPADTFSLREAYYGKTMRRLSQIRDLVPLADRKTITVNGQECRNVYFYRRDLERRLEALRCDSFAFIHGDCTFSNLLLRDDKEPVFIDPRGYFGHTELYGDPNYDWAKLYYSLAGNYDRFNLRDFRLTIGGDVGKNMGGSVGGSIGGSIGDNVGGDIGDSDVDLRIGSNHWEALADDFFRLSGADPKTIKLLHGVIWLSLTTYAWQDYDSICGAFYNGLYHLEEAL
ncbi:MAG: phosphotransferase [Peptococcaceae bacterium]|nr:phosphotransferase [Peptococcaceae bacterium]